MKAEGCELYEMARQLLRSDFPKMLVRQPKSLFWKTFEPSLGNSLAVDNTLAYVVYDNLVDIDDVDTALQLASTYVPSGQIVIFAHQGARVHEEVARVLPDSNVSVRFVAGCPCGR